jgi:predicted acetyltransferase
MSLEIRNVSDGELDAFRECIYNTFGDDLESDVGGDERIKALIPEAQRWAAFDGPIVVATAGTFDHAIGVPGGGTLPMAGLTVVTVRPTHRRRGILRQLMERHLDDARRRGFPVSGLWASEAGIYGRFGYGLATHTDVITIENAQTVELHPRSGSDAIEWIDESAARTRLPEVYARATAARPGALRRSAVWWHQRRFLESAFVRHGASKRRHVIARRDGAIVGYLQFRQRGAFEPSRPNGKIEIVELIGIDSRAELTLWELALRMDLFPNVAWNLAPVDDALAWAVVDQRRIQRRRTDALFLRIEDLPATLAARTYPIDGTLRFAIGDATWELIVDGGRARCATTAKPAELRFGPTTLASLYLGGVSATQLARSEQLRGDAAAITRADALFASAIAPWCPEVF